MDGIVFKIIGQRLLHLISDWTIKKSNETFSTGETEGRWAGPLADYIILLITIGDFFRARTHTHAHMHTDTHTCTHTDRHTRTHAQTRSQRKDTHTHVHTLHTEDTYTVNRIHI